MATSAPKMYKAALLNKLGPNEQIQWNDVPLPPPSALLPGQCLVEMEYASVCHSDLGIKNNEYAACVLARLPLVGGHEGVGRIVTFAENIAAPGFAIGDRVGIKWIADSCLNCDACRRGSEWHCSNIRNSGLTTNGTFQQFLIGYVNGLVRIPEGVSSEAACPILCAGVTVYKALRCSNTIAGDWVVIPGAGGGLGHLAVQYANAMGLRVIAIDTGNDKKTLCESLGAEAWIDFRDTPDIPRAVLSTTGGKGAKAAVIAAAVVSPYAQALDYLAQGGTLVAVGLPPRAKLEVDIGLLVAKCIRIEGSFVGNRQDTIEALRLVECGKVKPHYTVEPYGKLNEVYEAMESGKLSGRVVLKLWDA